VTQPIVFAKDSLLRLNGNRLSDHNRSEMSVSTERIEQSKRMANGTLRKYVVADKRSWSVSWEDIPHSSAFTVDGFWGGEDMEIFFRSAAGQGQITLTIVRNSGSSTSHNVVISSFERKIKKRGDYEFWDVSLELEEV
jgi:hypothetical protein